jgi:hypothetical protein
MAKTVLPALADPDGRGARLCGPVEGGILDSRTFSKECGVEKDGDRIVETATEAREAVNVKGVTTVLGVSIALAVIAGIAVWWFVIH